MGSEGDNVHGAPVRKAVAYDGTREMSIPIHGKGSGVKRSSSLKLLLLTELDDKEDRVECESDVKIKAGGKEVDEGAGGGGGGAAAAAEAGTSPIAIICAKVSASYGMDRQASS